MDRIILASKSPRRLQLLQQAGYAAEVFPSSFEEETSAIEPGQIAMDLSRGKAEDVARQVESQEERIVLGSDTIVVLDQKILGKPADEEDAFRMLSELSGKVHSVYTGVTLIGVKEGRITRQESFFEKTDVHVLPLSKAEIRSYIATGDPLDKAGAYGIQGEFARFIDRIDGEYNTVVGLPVCAVYQKLKSWQFT